MKKLLLIAIIIAFAFPVMAGDAGKEKFEVKIEVVYNEVPTKEAVAIISEALSKHGGACNVVVKVKKIGNNDLATFHGGNVLEVPDQNTWHGPNVTLPNGELRSKN